MAAGLLKAVSRLMDLSLLPIEPVLRLLSRCCLSLLTLLVTQQQQQQQQQDQHKWEAIWGVCVASLSTVPRLLRMVLQLRVADLSQEELPQLGQILYMLMQHTPLHNQLIANTSLLQELIQHLTRYSRGPTREQWLTDLLYSYSVTVAHGTSSQRGNLRDVY